MRRQFVRTTSVVVFAGALLAACGTGQQESLTSSVTASQSSTPEPTYVVGTQSQTASYPAPGISLAPAGSAAPRITAEQAWQAYRSNGSGFSASAGQTVIKLVRYTNSHRGTENADGSVTPASEDRLVWLIEIPSVKTQIHGVTISYPYFVAVDATSADVIEAVQSSQFVVSTS